MTKPLPLLILFALLIALVWINPALTLLAGRLFVIALGLAVGLFFGSFYARARQAAGWTVPRHFKYVAQLLLEQLR